MKTKEGYIKTKLGKVWYKIIGEKINVPLIVLHGGPGAPHHYLEPLRYLGNRREVIFYDQIGCGNSDRLEKKFWKVKTFVGELREIIKRLNLKEYHILGQSWGSALAISFALTNPKGLKSIVLASPYLSTPAWMKDAKRLIKKLPKKMQRALKKSKTDSKEYKEASDEYYQRFVRRMSKLPKVFKEMRKVFGHDVYLGMWGPKEFEATGTLKNFDLTPKLNKIKYPVLFVTGRYDEATPETVHIFHKIIPNSEMEIFEKSAHYSHWTERKKFIKVVQNFLIKIEQNLNIC